MARCPNCGDPSFMGNGFRGSGVCKGCYWRDAGQMSSGLSQHRASPVGSVGPEPVEKKICPACGQTIKPPPLSNAERQRRHRERKRNGLSQEGSWG